MESSNQRTRAEEIMEMHNGAVVDIQASTIIRVAGIPFIVMILLTAVYIHYLRFTFLMVCSMFVVVPFVTALCFLFSKYTRDYVSRKVLLEIYGFDSVAAHVIQQFCAPPVAMRLLTAEFDRKVKANASELRASEIVLGQQLVLLRQQAAESFVTKINKRIAEERLDQHDFTMLGNKPSICITGTLKARIYSPS